MGIKAVPLQRKTERHRSELGKRKGADARRGILVIKRKDNITNQWNLHGSTQSKERKMIMINAATTIAFAIMAIAVIVSNASVFNHRLD